MRSFVQLFQAASGDEVKADFHKYNSGQAMQMQIKENEQQFRIRGKLALLGARKRCTQPVNCQPFFLLKRHSLPASIATNDRRYLTAPCPSRPRT